MTDRQQEMARLYSEEHLTYAEIADRFGVTKQRVGQVLGPLSLSKGEAQRRLVMRHQELRDAHARITEGVYSASQEAEKLGYGKVEYMKEAMRKLGLKFPPRPRPAKHGEHLRYKRGCRCAKCTKANREYARSLKGTEPPAHGTESAYINYGCRCTPCTRARSAAERARKALRRQRKEAPQ